MEGARELTQHLKILATLVENQISVTTLSLAVHNLQSQLQSAQHPPLASMGTCTLCIYSCTGTDMYT